MWDYTDKVKEHFKNPKNVGSISNACATGEVGSMLCGDALKLMLKIDEKTGKITDAKFQTFGCASAIASSSALTEMIKGMTVEEASKITNQDIANFLGSLPEQKMHCSVMGMEALQAAIESYKTGGKPIKHEESKGKIVCQCFSVTGETIIKTIKENALSTVEEVTNFTKAGGSCGKCKPDIQEILNSVLANKGKSGPFSEMTMVEKIHAVESAISKEITPRLNADGGSIELVDIKDNVIKVKMTGMCKGCPSAGFTLKNFVEKKLKEIFGGSIKVEEEI